MPDKSSKIEDLLEHLGTSELPDDLTHRYELRRSLLCSRYFDEAHQRDAKRSRFLVYTAPLFAGVVLVVVFSVAGTYMVDQHQTLVLEPQPTIDTSHMLPAERLAQITYVAAKEPPRVDVAEYIDTTQPPVALPSSLRFVPISPQLTFSVQ